MIGELQRAGIKAAIISIDLTEPVPMYRVALSEDGADCDELRGVGMTLETAVHFALERRKK